MAEPSVVTFKAMGSPCRIVVVGGPLDLPQRLRALVEELELRWSRFLPSSEISAVNRLAGAVTVVSPQTYELIDRAVTGHRLTQGWFNPLMLDQLERQGYDRPWDDERLPAPTGLGPDVGPACTETIALYPEASAVRLPPHTRFDPGGIGKGFAVDLAIESSEANGAASTSIELGGDLRVHGQPWYGDSWRIGIANPFDRSADIASFTPVAGGAVTTSTTLRRRWTHQGRNLHHLLDPTTGRPGETDIVAATTCSSVAWWAEVAAKAALLAGSDRATTMLDDLATPGIAVTSTGDILRTAATATVSDALTASGVPG